MASRRAQSGRLRDVHVWHDVHAQGRRHFAPGAVHARADAQPGVRLRARIGPPPLPAAPSHRRAGARSGGGDPHRHGHRRAGRVLDTERRGPAGTAARAPRHPLPGGADHPLDSAPHSRRPRRSLPHRVVPARDLDGRVSARGVVAGIRGHLRRPSVELLRHDRDASPARSTAGRRTRPTAVAPSASRWTARCASSTKTAPGRRPTRSAASRSRAPTCWTATCPTPRARPRCTARRLARHRRPVPRQQRRLLRLRRTAQDRDQARRNHRVSRRRPPPVGGARLGTGGRGDRRARPDLRADHRGVRGARRRPAPPPTSTPSARGSSRPNAGRIA